MNDAWIADRMRHIDASGIRKAFEMGKAMKDPIDLSIGLPDFDVAEPVKLAAIEAVERGFNAYTVTQGMPELRGALQETVDAKYRHGDRQVMVTSGTSGALLLALCCTVDPGDEVILFDPYFVMYRHLVTLAGGRSVLVDTYPDFRIDAEKVAAAITPRTKAVLVNTPGNPSGVVVPPEDLEKLAELCRERDVLLISDEVYSAFCYDAPFASPASWNEDVLVVDGFSKSHAMTGWRLGYAHGPSRLIQEMAKLQQFSYICAPSIAQKAGVAALGVDLSKHGWPNIAGSATWSSRRWPAATSWRRPSGAFYAFPRAPRGSGTVFVAEAVRPGTCSSSRGRSSAAGTPISGSRSRSTTGPWSGAWTCCVDLAEARG